MSNKRKILLIENQYTQFQTISKLLDTAGYEVCPKENEACEFKYFIDLVRVLLNERYSTDRRDKAFEKLLEIINTYKPELLIIDHILVGNHSAKNGIDLAIKFRDKQISQSIIFLSRTERNNLNVCQDLSNLKEEIFWINKGYSGKQILEKKSFEREVVPKIKTLLGKSELLYSNEFIDKKILEYLDKLNNEKVVENANNQNNERTISLTSLSNLIALFKEFKKNELVISDRIKTVFSELQNISSEQGLFEEAEWKIKCNELIELVK